METAEKKCRKCGEVKALSEFYKRSDRSKKTSSECKYCLSKRLREYNKTNKDRRRESSRNYYKLHKDSLYKKGREWRMANMPRVRKYKRDSAAALSDSYVKEVLSGRTGISFADISPELIELKRIHLQLIRELKNGKCSGIA